MTSTANSRNDTRTPFLIAALSLAAIIPALGFPVYFRTDDVHWLGWAATHPNPLAAFNPGENLFGYYRPIPTLVWWVLFHLFGFNPLPYQVTLALTAVLAMIPLFRIAERLGGGPLAGLLAVGLFHAAWFGILYYVFWFSALTFGLEILFLLLAFDALADGTSLPGRPVAFVLAALAAGFCKQPALILLPVVGGWLLLDSTKGKQKSLWLAGIFLISLGLLFLTPFVVHRPERLAGLTDGGLAEFALERFRFYAGTLLKGTSGVIVAAAAGAAIGRRAGRGWIGFAVGGAHGFACGRIDPFIGFPLWAAVILGAAVAEKKSRPWVAGFFVPLIALLGVDFFVATYLLEPVLMLVPAMVLWLGPLVEPLAVPIESRLADRRLRIATSAAAVAGAALVILAAWPRVTPIVSMREVRATFRELVEYLVTTEENGVTLGSLSYDELGRTYAEIRGESLERRVAQHKTMNPAQLGKLLKLRGRGDLSVVTVTEARDATGVRRLVALNDAEREILKEVPEAREIRVFEKGSASSAIYELTQ